jgi:hypothetical protein
MSLSTALILWQLFKHFQISMVSFFLLHESEDRMYHLFSAVGQTLREAVHKAL